MLEPQSRRLLLEALAPPAGYRFDRAVGTTFTLDLLALLTAPLAFSLIDITEADGGRPVVDPLALLEAARRHARRITVFTDAGHVAVPKPGQPLFALLEDSVVPVVAPRPGGLFHPKVWLVRYVADDGPPVLRLLCSSRNLTFDRSWDTLLVLDAPVADGDVAESAPLARFITALPGMAVNPPSDRIADDVDSLAADIRRARFAAPEGLELAAFHPMGLDGRSEDPFAGRIDRLLVVSPFVGGARLSRLAGRRKTNVLVSRPEELAKVESSELAGYVEILVLSDHAVAEPRENEGEAVASEAAPTGLHAKVYVADAGWNARLWTGSANATDQAFGANVEFMVELTGRKRVCGIDALLSDGTRGVPGMRTMLDGYRMHDVPAPVDPDEDRRRHLFDAARSAIVRTSMRATIAPSVDDGTFDLRLESRPARELDVPEGVDATCQPISIGAGGAVPLRLAGPAHAEFTGLEVRELSAFFAVALTISASGESERFTLAVPLEGAPSDRAAVVLSQLIRSRRDLLRFLLLLLAADESRASDRLGDLRRLLGAGFDGDGGASAGLPLLEPMLRALARDPGRIDQIARVIEDLQASSEGRERLPERLDDVWPALLAARRAMRA